MLDQTIEDSGLINLIKNEQNSEALQLLVSRHSGIYVSVIEKYSFVPFSEKRDLLEDKMLNIYNYVLDFDETKKCKFSTYVGKKITWTCQSLLNKYQEPCSIEEIEEPTIENTGFDEMENLEILSYIETESQKNKDPRFAQIMKMRLQKPTKKTWDEIGEVLGITKEGARKIYKRNIEKFKNRTTANL